MVHKMSKKVLSLLLILTMVVSVFSIGAVTASAATTLVPIKILNVNRRYRDVTYFMTLLNERREKQGVSKLKLDAALTEKAMKRAAEQPFLDSPNSMIDGTSVYADGDYIISRNLPSYRGWFKSLVSDYSNTSLMDDDCYASVGVGYVIVEKKAYGCILFSENEAKSTPDSNLLAQYNWEIAQETNVKSNLLEGSGSAYLDGQKVLCGVSFDPIFELEKDVTENGSTKFTMSARYTSDQIVVESTDPKIFSFDNHKVKALYPGKCFLKMSIPNVYGVYFSQQFEAVGNKLSSCSVSGIEDQFYTGEYLRPGVTVTDSSGKMLEIGNDYRVEYINNKEIGVATVKVIGMNSYTGSETTQTFNIVKSPYGAFRVTEYSDKRVLYIGENTTVTTKITDQQTTVYYTFEYAEYDTNQWKELQASSTKSTCTFNLNLPGKFNIRVTAVDTKGRRASTMLSFEVENRMVLKVSQHISEVKLGETYNVTSIATGGTAPLIYTCTITKGSFKKALTNTGGHEKGQFSFMPPVTGTYNVALKVTGATGKTDTQYVSFKVTGENLTGNSSLSATEVGQGSSVTVKAGGKGGVGSYKYAVYYKKKSQTSWTTVQDYRSNSTVKISPASVTDYDVCVKVKDEANVVAKQYFTFTVKKVALKNNSYLSTSRIHLGESVQVRGIAAGGSGSYRYAVYYKKKSQTSWTTVQNYSTNSTIKVTPNRVDEYEICVKVKDKSNSVVKKYFTVKVEKPALKNTSSLSKLNFTQGESIQVTCAATGGTAPYQYAVYYKKAYSGSWVTVQNYSTNTKVSIKPATDMTYDVCVKVKDKSGTISKKYFTLNDRISGILT